jgi:preprotein translocase subunit SecE
MECAAGALESQSRAITVDRQSGHDGSVSMGKEKEVALGGFWRDMFQVGLYKRTQGRIARQVTFAALAIMIVIGALRMSETFGSTAFLRYALPGIVVVVGLWLCFRLVNLPKFADFLIAVEAEMTKVSWPTRPELIRGSVVVIVTLFFLAAMLTIYDLVWQFILHVLGVR